MKTIFDFNSQSFTIDVIPSGKSYRATIGDKTIDVEILRADAERGQLELLMDGERVTAYVSSDNAKRWVTINGQTVVVTKSSSAKRGSGRHDHSGELTAPMPGQVRTVNVREGDVVTKGQTLMVLEAMKMEIRIQAPMNGMVTKLSVKQGQAVEKEQVLVELEER